MSSGGWSDSGGGGFDRWRRRNSDSTPATSVSVWSGSGDGGGGGGGGVAVTGVGVATEGVGGNGIGAGGYGYGYTHPFVPTPLLPLFSAQHASSSVIGSAIGTGGSENSASTISEYWPYAGGSGGNGFRYWNNSAPVRSSRGVVDSWDEGEEDEWE